MKYFLLLSPTPNNPAHRTSSLPFVYVTLRMFTTQWKVQQCIGKWKNIPSKIRQVHRIACEHTNSVTEPFSSVIDAER